jgi:hypothetical protein
MATSGVLPFKMREPKNNRAEIEAVWDGCTLFCRGRGGASHGVACDPPGGPSGLKVKATGETIDIKGFPCEIKARNKATFHCFEINFVEGDSSAGNELLLIHTFPGDEELGGGKDLRDLKGGFAV